LVNARTVCRASGVGWADASALATQKKASQEQRSGFTRAPLSLDSASMRVAVRRHHGIRMNMKPLCRSRASFHGFCFAIAGRRIRDQRMKQFMSDPRHIVDRAVESFFVRLGRFREAAQFPNKLE
jgi:hypothetical protein